MSSKTTLSADARQQAAQESEQPRTYKFPPLRKNWHGDEGEAERLASTNVPATSASFQQGWREGMSQGFAQGLEEGKTTGYQEGMKLGFEEGKQRGVVEGKQQAHQTFLAAAEPFAQMLQTLRDFNAHQQQQYRKELLQLVEKVARQVIRCEMELQPKQLLALVEEALSSLDTPPKQVQVLLNQEDFDRINDADAEKTHTWRLMADSDLARGECRIVTTTTEMDVGCEHRLQQCMTVLQQNLLPEQPS